jgi:hypothetical protein
MAEEDNRWNTDPLTEIQIAQIGELMKINPEADQLFVESVVRLGTGRPEKLAEFVRGKKEGKYKGKPVRLTEDELRIKCVEVLPEEIV